MSPAVRRLSAALNIEGRSRKAVDMLTMFMVNIDHAALRMMLAVRRLGAALDIEGRLLSAQGM